MYIGIKQGMKEDLIGSAGQSPSSPGESHWLGL